DRMWGSEEMPSLLIVDLFESAAPSADAALLASWAKLVPIWILARHGSREASLLEGHGFERVLSRPQMVGKLVQEIKERLAG
ncbi:MAG TPA: hypothetical protein VFJ52_13080, partial [Terriglobia bacterium]|nr:hypothetical protein [Terriglobia bacterium]